MYEHDNSLYVIQSKPVVSQVCPQAGTKGEGGGEGGGIRGRGGGF